jgi:putative membrane protein
MNEKIRAFFQIFIRGAAMGAAEIIPGISGGTIAFITGIYDRLIKAISSFDLTAIKLLKNGDWKALWQHIDGNFLTFLLAGMAMSILLMLNLITYLLANYPIQIWSFFFGLIFISAFFVLRDISKWNAGVVLSLVIGTIIGFFISSATPATTPDSLIFIFFSGFIAISALILPGISGSFILLILGKYTDILKALKEFDFVIILVFATGCIFGLLLFSRFVSWLLKNYASITIATLAGFMLGSLYRIWPWRRVVEFRINSKGEQVPFLEENLLPQQFQEITSQDPQILQAALLMLFGIFIVVAIEKINSALNPTRK